MIRTFDFEAINRQVDLRSLIEAELGPPIRGGRWACPIHQGDGPNLGIYLDGQTWRWKCHVCSAGGDAVDWLREVNRIPTGEAVRMLTGEIAPPRRPKAVPRPSVPKPRVVAAWEDPAWQAEAKAIVGYAESVLWSVDGRLALDWLRRRGLEDRTIRKFRLGFTPEPLRTPSLEILPFRDGRPQSAWLPRGVVIPWLRPGSWYESRDLGDGADPGPRWVGLNCRRLADDVDGPLLEGPKYSTLTGSTRGYAYPWPTLDASQGHPPAMILEGEFDALLAEQAVGHLVYATTTGGAQQTPHLSALEALGYCPWWLVATDHDDRGDEAAMAWFERDRDKYRRLYLPHGKDLSEYVVAGGDVCAWLRSEADQIRAAMRT